MPAHIYFDLDGTLTDPYEGITKCILYALDKLEFPHPSDEYLLTVLAWAGNVRRDKQTMAGR